MIQNDKNEGKMNRYYMAVFKQHFTYICFTYRLSNETTRDERQQNKEPDILDGQI
jgi:hypothetical protein